jgi:DNA-binding beta-propeller fold protein YncE
MANFGDQILGVSFQTAGSAIDPGSNSVYITAIINGTVSAIAAGVDLESSSDIILGANQAINLDPPFKVPADETVTPAAGVTIGYFIAK